MKPEEARADLVGRIEVLMRRVPQSVINGNVKAVREWKEAHDQRRKLINGRKASLDTLRGLHDKLLKELE